MLPLLPNTMGPLVAVTLTPTHAFKDTTLLVDCNKVLPLVADKVKIPLATLIIPAPLAVLMILPPVTVFNNNPPAPRSTHFPYTAHLRSSCTLPVMDIRTMLPLLPNTMGPLVAVTLTPTHAFKDTTLL